jgi:hypothetical protein
VWSPVGMHHAVRLDSAPSLRGPLLFSLEGGRKRRCENPSKESLSGRAQVTKGRVAIKMWDLGGQPRFRSMWERYCRGVSVIVYIVDAADHDSIDVARAELHDLLARPTLAGIPLLVLGNAPPPAAAPPRQYSYVLSEGRVCGSGGAHAEVRVG